MKHFLLPLAVILFSCLPSAAQQLNPSTEGSRAYAILNQQPPSPQAQPLNPFYDTTACGLNYTQRSVRLGLRGSINGAAQPAVFNITGIPSCSVVEKAFLWATAAGNGVPVTATIVNPSSQSANYPMTIAGSDVDMCWGYPGTYTYHADVTSCIAGNGNYLISGLPASSSTSASDVDGATLLIIYRDFTATYTGSIWIKDGCSVVQGGSHSETFSNINLCQNSTSANGFSIVADLQFAGSQYQINGGPVQTYNAFDWWDFVSGTTTISSSQSTANITYTSSGDCYAVAAMGLYAQTACNSCGSGSGVLTVTSTSTPANCNGNGSATVTATGGTGPYTYLWLPGNYTTATVNNLAPGTYTVIVQDPTHCGSTTITISYTGMTASSTATPISCSALGTATATPTGGTGPYSYLWLPGGQTTASVSGLSAGSYTCTITDSGNCTATTSCTVVNNSALTFNSYTTAAGCGLTNGVAASNVSGGNPPYSYLWSTGAITPNISGAAGSYTVTVTDALGCVASAILTIGTQPLAITVSAQPTVISCSMTSQLSTYPNFAATTYSWSPAFSLNNATAANPVASPTVTTTYTVTASNPSCGSISGVVTITVDTNFAANESICLVTVDSVLQKNVVVIERNTLLNSGTYDIYKEVPLLSGNYVLYASQPVTQLSQYVDQGSSPMTNADRYKIQVTDSCGRHSVMSTAHRSIYLNVTTGVAGSNNLVWNHSQGFTFNVYNIWRGTNPGQLSLLTTVQSNVQSYNDPSPPAGTVYYAVEALHPAGCVATSPMTMYGSAWSNLESNNPNGIDDKNLVQQSISLRPNPASSNFLLSFMMQHAGKAELNISDLTGRILYAEQFDASGITEKNISGHGLAAGTYLVSVKTISGLGVCRLVIE